MEYKRLSLDDLPDLAKAYVSYYNGQGDAWTQDQAYERIHQVMTTKGALCFAQYLGKDMTGFVMGYLKTYDDLTSYNLEEILIFLDFQNKGYGQALMRFTEAKAREAGARLLELTSLQDEHHQYFYGKLGYYVAENMIPMAKFLGGD